MPRVHHVDLKSVALQDPEQGDPINAWRLHKDPFLSHKPSVTWAPMCMQVRRETFERSHWLGAKMTCQIPYRHCGLILSFILDAPAKPSLLVDLNKRFREDRLFQLVQCFVRKNQNT